MRGVLSMVVLCASLAGCAEPGEYYVGTAPPPPQQEVVGVAPYSDGVWINGVWVWEGGRHVWRGGHWEHARRGYTYVPHRWENRGGRYAFVRGGWRRH